MLEEFKTKEELFIRIRPALYSKIQEFKRKKINYIKEEDIWNYLSRNKWNKAENLSLTEMVSDIMNVNEEDMKLYVFEILKKQDRELDKEEGELL